MFLFRAHDRCDLPADVGNQVITVVRSAASSRPLLFCTRPSQVVRSILYFDQNVRVARTRAVEQQGPIPLFVPSTDNGFLDSALAEKIRLDGLGTAFANASALARGIS